MLALAPRRSHFLNLRCGAIFPGWYSVPLMQNRKKMGIKNCDITAYANDYAQAMGRNPFASKDPIVKE